MPKILSEYLPFAFYFLVVDTFLAEERVFSERPISVFPYYVTLGIALYGKEKPLRKLPAPYLVTLDPLIWKILQKKHHLIERKNYKWGRCHCEVTWPQVSCKGLEVTLGLWPPNSRKNKDQCHQNLE